MEAPFTVQKQLILQCKNMIDFYRGEWGWLDSGLPAGSSRSSSLLVQTEAKLLASSTPINKKGPAFAEPFLLMGMAGLEPAEAEAGGFTVGYHR